jgi:hypothetical protein
MQKEPPAKINLNNEDLIFVYLSLSHYENETKILSGHISFWRSI